MPFIRESYIIHTPIKAITFLTTHLHFPPSIAQKIIDKHRFRTSDNTPIQKSHIISGEVWLTRFCAHYYPPSELSYPIFKTREFVAFNKPSKLLTHPKGTFTHKSLLDSIRFFCGKEAQSIHRLDYETSGIILVATTKHSEIALKHLLATQQLHKLYIAKVQGILREQTLISAPITTPSKIRHHNLSIRSRIDTQGKDSHTLLTPIGYDATCTYVYAIPLTGRTHQIRLHCAHIGHAICGDLLYGVSDSVSEAYLSALQQHFYAESKASYLQFKASTSSMKSKASSATSKSTEALQSSQAFTSNNNLSSFFYAKSSKAPSLAFYASSQVANNLKKSSPNQTFSIMPHSLACSSNNASNAFISYAKKHRPHIPPHNNSQYPSTHPNTAHLLSQELCLHALQLRYCLNGIAYILSTPMPSWWKPKDLTSHALKHFT